MFWHQQDGLDSAVWHDQNADTALVPHGYWSLSLAADRRHWHLSLVEQNEDLDEVIAEPFRGDFRDEAAAKEFAEESERRGYVPGQGIA